MNGLRENNQEYTECLASLRFHDHESMTDFNHFQPVSFSGHLVH